jgi:hypothetical protein
VTSRIATKGAREEGGASLIDWREPERNVNVLDWRECARAFGLVPLDRQWHSHTPIHRTAIRH